MSYPVFCPFSNLSNFLNVEFWKLFILDMNLLLQVDQIICWCPGWGAEVGLLLLPLGMDQVPYWCVVMLGKEGPRMAWGFLATAKGGLACLLLDSLLFFFSPSFPPSSVFMPLDSGLQVFLVSSPGYMGHKMKTQGLTMMPFSKSWDPCHLLWSFLLLPPVEYFFRYLCL